MNAKRIPFLSRAGLAALAACAGLACGRVAAAEAVVPTAPAPLVVASLNPILTDIARQVGGDAVTVIEILKPGENPHSFTPAPDDLRRMQEAVLILAAGKGLERYLDDVRGSLTATQRLIEVGQHLPGLPAPAAHDHDHDHSGDQGGGAARGPYLICPDGDMVGDDPHWWQSIANVQRAARIVATAFVQEQPGRAAEFRRGQIAYVAQLDLLTSWVRQEVARIPPDGRKLATAHAAFSYFCSAYGFQAVPIQGLTAEQEPSPVYLREVVDTIRREHVRAIFPEVGTNPKILENMVRETGVRVGGRLLAGTPAPEAPTYEDMMRYNVATIVKALAPAP